ncbi:MAG: ketoacyl-ACP synthase III [Chloroflexi bacterium]|nr:ketoacyl-ACP synthase III [Chloroflexota bacterium]
MTKYAEIVGWGKYLPSKVVTNDDLAKTVDTSDEWIVSHTGIRERRIVGAGETTVSMAVAAARSALLLAELQPTDIDLIIVSTYSPDYHLPGAAPMVQAQLGATRAAAFDLRAGCPGFVYGLAVGSQFIASGTFRRVLVIGAEIVSHFVNWQDRRTCVLFGDGAGAIVLEASDQPTGVLSFSMGTQGADHDALTYRAAGSVYPVTDQPFEESIRYLQMDGRRVLSFAMRQVGPAIYRELSRNGLSKEDIALVIPQQSNQRFIEWISTKLGFPMEKVFVNVDRYANTSSASIAVALCEAFEEGRIKDGDNVLLVSFGAGLNWAASVVRYGVTESAPVSVVDAASRRLPSLEELRFRVESLTEMAMAGVANIRDVLLLPFYSWSKGRKKE